MTAALKPSLQHSYRLSAFERRDNDFYPTPSDLVASLPLGLSRLGLELPGVALDPCGGDGALRARPCALWGRREVDRSLPGYVPRR
jgi:hypothetical protein